MNGYFKTHPLAKTGLIGVLLLLFVVVMGMFFPKGAFNKYDSFILAFEFAKTPDDIKLIFNGLTSETIRNIDIGNYVDYGFMLAYSTLLGLAFYLFSKENRLHWLKYGIILVTIIFTSDFIENIFLLRLTGNVLNTSAEAVIISNLKFLSIITYSKWTGLAVAFFILYAFFYFQRWYFEVLGIFFLLPLLYFIATPQHSPENLSVFTNLIFLSFAILVMFFFLFKKKI